MKMMILMKMKREIVDDNNNDDCGVAGDIEQKEEDYGKW